MGWLLVAAAVLALFARLYSSADTALLRVSRAGAKELATSANEPSPPLSAVLTEVPKYIAVLLLGQAPGDRPDDQSGEGDRLAWAADDLPGQAAAEIAERAAELDDRSSSPP